MEDHGTVVETVAKNTDHIKILVKKMGDNCQNRKKQKFDHGDDQDPFNDTAGFGMQQSFDLIAGILRECSLLRLPF